MLDWFDLDAGSRVFDKITYICLLSPSVTDKRVPYTFFSWSMLRRFFSSWIVILIFPIRESWLEIIRFFMFAWSNLFYLNVTREWITELNVTREPFCFAWWIPGFLVVLKMNCSQPVVVKFWPGFWQDMNFIWINESHKPDHWWSLNK